MPLQGLDFSRSNQALARFNQFLSYDLLDQMRSDRDVDIMKIQDRLMREREVERGNIDIGVARYKSALTDKEAYIQAGIDINKMPWGQSMAARARMATDPNLPPEYHAQAIADAKEFAAAILPLAEAHYNTSRGQATKEDFAVLNKYGGYKGAEEAYKETGANIRASRQAGIEEQKIGIEREKLTDVGAGRTQAATEKMTDRYLKWVDDTVSYLVGEGVQSQAMTGEMPIYLESKSRDPLSSQDRGFALTHLQNIKTQILRQGYETLTDGQLSFISKVYNTPAVQGFVTEKLKTTPVAQAAGARPPRPGGAVAPEAGGTQAGLSPITGATTPEYDQALGSVRQTWINQKAAEFIKAVYGEAPATPEIQQEAMKYATEYVDTRIMPSLMKR